MKKILCPIDFSVSSKNGMEYAANVAKAIKASLSLFYVRLSIWPEAVQLEKEATEGNEAILNSLSLFASEVHTEFGIQCDYYLEQTTHTFEEAVATKSSRYDLVVMGTNGADNIYQYVFGSNTFHVVEKSKCPVLIIPEGCAYHPVSLMVYAYDPDTNPFFLVDQLKKFSIPIGTEIRVLHILEESLSLKDKRRMEILEDALKAREAKNILWSFDFNSSNEVSWALDRYMKMNNADILALSFHHRTLMERLFNENVVQQMSMKAEYPVFVFWC